MEDLQTQIEQVREEIRKAINWRNELTEEREVVNQELNRLYHNLDLFKLIEEGG